MRYLLDTNTISDLIRNPRGRVAQRVQAVGEARVCTSIIVAAELRYGVSKRASPRLLAEIQTLFTLIDVLPFEAPADEAYGMIRTHLEKAGTPIGGNDMLIAAHAIALGCTVVTDNEGEFGRIEGLPHENWLRTSTNQ